MLPSAALYFSLSCLFLLRPCSAGGCSGSAEACKAAVEEPGGALGLLQHSSGKASSQRQASVSATELGKGAGQSSAQSANSRGLAASAGHLRFAVDAERVPHCSWAPTPLCAAPYSCESSPLTPEETDYWHDVHVATDDGRPNLRAWCLDPVFEQNNVKLCLDNHDLAANAQALFKLQVARGLGETDGSYCFLEGHCTNTNITYNTTPEDAEAVCDAKYGHENWTSLRFADKPEERAEMLYTGFASRLHSSYYGQLACAMGNFHCDVIYCQDTYCKQQEYVEKYSHFLKEYGYTS